jgi:alpha-D-ribose 1-methylphosphonate 5-triphosphate synthase subunit PhnH
MNAVEPIDAGTLARVGHSFAQPVAASQQCFRALLQAMSRPGRVQALPPAALQGLQPPGLGPALTAVLLTLLDAEVQLWLDPRLDAAGAAAFLRFHTGVKFAARRDEAAFVALPAEQASAALWRQLRLGSDAAPQDGATLIVEVPALMPAPAVPGQTLCLRGPGIQDTHRLVVAGLNAAFWQARAALAAEFPRGVDLLLCSGDHLAALPRTTQVTLED